MLHLYLTSILVNNTKVCVETRGNFSDPFITNKGVAQADCFSAILFVFYLACSLFIDNIDNTKSQIVLSNHGFSIVKTDFNQQGHYFATPYGYSPKDVNPPDITSKSGSDSQYADDLSWFNWLKAELDCIKTLTTPRLAEHSLLINNSKTEDFHFSRGTNYDWKNCKFLATSLDTNQIFDADVRLPL